MCPQLSHICTQKCWTLDWEAFSQIDKSGKYCSNPLNICQLIILHVFFLQLTFIHLTYAFSHQMYAYKLHRQLCCLLILQSDGSVLDGNFLGFWWILGTLGRGWREPGNITLQRHANNDIFGFLYLWRTHDKNATFWTSLAGQMSVLERF